MYLLSQLTFHCFRFPADQIPQRPLPQMKWRKREASRLSLCKKRDVNGLKIEDGCKPERQLVVDSQLALWHSREERLHENATSYVS